MVSGMDINYPREEVIIVVFGKIASMFTLLSESKSKTFNSLRNENLDRYSMSLGFESKRRKSISKVSNPIKSEKGSRKEKSRVSPLLK